MLFWAVFRPVLFFPNLTLQIQTCKKHSTGNDTAFHTIFSTDISTPLNFPLQLQISLRSIEIQLKSAFCSDDLLVRPLHQLATRLHLNSSRGNFEPLIFQTIRALPNRRIHSRCEPLKTQLISHKHQAVSDPRSSSNLHLEIPVMTSHPPTAVVQKFSTALNAVASKKLSKEIA